ncbi:ATPase, V1 complex, subunit F [Carpediemonas membranifera]|uniref:ATPase, V1 complex, subunit F n=1 Tax=Carpediemonas membranifera TaxID=201153 RepID=A0A8J6B1P4_9EUKA|nr:ATPase, V1 complex, subunit F [Carpediemonas membranifera]|eukprot:KAG9391034.1 ATPase, V1 complex, subunit F [Carpediemonas membranifera]
MSTGQIAIIADESTVVGFLLAGTGSSDHSGNNYLIVEPETQMDEIKSYFEKFTDPKSGISIILISQAAAKLIRRQIDNYTAIVPVILELPIGSYDPKEDPLMERVAMILGRGDL